jgi:lipoprotein LprG
MLIARLAGAAAVAVVLALTGCSGDDDGAGDDSSPEEVLELAKQQLDETSGVHVVLTTGDLPSSVQGVTRADGIGTNQPAFDGTITVSANGLPLEVDVIAVDGKVFARFPDWREVDPEALGAPDPANLLATEGGLSDLLVNTDELEKGEEVRQGEANDEIVTEYTGTVPSDLVTAVIPSASGDDFAVRYTIDDEGRLTGAELTGEFYPDTDDLTYTVAFDDYGTDQVVTAP